MKIKRHTISVVETILFICAIFIAIGIALPIYMHSHTNTMINKHYYQDQIMNNNTSIKTYDAFWQEYQIILNSRGDSDGDHKISVQEKAAFDQAFFTNNGLVVDAVTKIVTRQVDGSQIDPKILLCHLMNFYPDKPWIQPVCANY